MPERAVTKNPTILAGTPLFSGDPNTGQVMFSQGGTKNFTNYSGTAGGDAAIWVGAGRLDSAFFNAGSIATLSGQTVTFYDAATAVSGGPLAASNHKILGILGFPPGNAPFVALSGQVFVAGQPPTFFGTVFTSGLCHTGRSGQLGFSAQYTPVVSN